MLSEAIYLSYFLNEKTPAYGGAENQVRLVQERSIAVGHTSNNLSIYFPAHIGTHIDFPYHFDNNGKKSNDYPASFWLFGKVGFLNCQIDEVPEKIQELPRDIELLILKTGFATQNRDKREYWASQPVIPASFGRLFRERFPLLRVFGFDMISLTSKLDREEGKKAHISFLLEENILVLEDMCLENIETAPGTVIVSPFLLEGADGVPCTIIAY